MMMDEIASSIKLFYVVIKLRPERYHHIMLMLSTTEYYYQMNCSIMTPAFKS